MLQILLSAVLGWITTYVLIAVLGSMYHGGSYTIRRTMRETYNFAIAVFGEKAMMFTAEFGFFIVFMVLLSWRKFVYVGQLHRSVTHIAEGHFDDAIPVKQRNELGDLAVQINLLVEQLKRSLDEERRAEQTKNELITNVSHDLRTPLTSILGYLGLVEQDRYRDEVELRHYIAIAYEKSQRLHVLINDLFEYTRMRNGTIPLQRIKVNLTELLGQLLVHHRITLQEAGMQGALTEAAPDTFVAGDPDKLMRVFENLMSNAVTYGKEGKRIDFSVRQEKGEAVTEVVNYGDPIPSTDLPYIFDRFYRVDKSRTEHQGGSGLGLAIVKSLVEMHDGSIEAQSDSRRTVFRVRLPLLAGEEKPE